MNQHNWRDKILGHLQFARHWLRQAEADFSRDDTLRGELNLALVEAEVRHAWELSAGKTEEIIPKRKHLWSWCLWAGTFFALLIVWQVELADLPRQTKVSVPVAQQAKPQPPVETEQPLPEQHSTEPLPVAAKASNVLPQITEKPAAAKLLPEPSVASVPALQEQKSEVREMKAAESEQPALPLAKPTKEETIEYDLRELTQLAQEVLYAKADS